MQSAGSEDQSLTSIGQPKRAACRPEDPIIWIVTPTNQRPASLDKA